MLPPGPEGETLEGETPCPATDGSEERVAVFAEAPPTGIDEGEALTAEIAIDEVDEEGTATDAGTITVTLDSEGVVEHRSEDRRQDHQPGRRAAYRQDHHQLSGRPRQPRLAGHRLQPANAYAVHPAERVLL